MKTISLLCIMMFSVSAIATAPKAQTKTQATICQALAEEADEDCVEIMCGEPIADGTFKDESECVGGSDYAEAAQVACEDTLSNAIARYNKVHPKEKVTCEDD